MNKALNFYVFTLVVPLLFISVSAKPQQSRTLFFLHNIPQATFVNPAIQPSCKYFIGVPVLSSLYANGSSTGFAYNDLVGFSPQNFVSNLHSVDFLAVDAHINIISLGYKRNDYYYSFNIAEKVFGTGFFPKNLLELAVNGNEQFIGNPLVTRSIGANATHLREYAFGLSQKVSVDYSWGVRGKLLFGKANVTTSRRPILFSTDEENYNLYAEWGFQVNSSVPLNITKLPNGNVDGVELGEIDPVSYLLNRSNLGFAADFGFVYTEDKTTWSGSVIDFGFVNWQSDTREFTNTGSFAFSGITLNDALDADNFIQNLRDSLTNQVKVKEKSKSYTSMLPTKVNIGATYSFHSKFNTGILLRTEFYPRRPVPSLTLSVNTQNTKKVFAGVSYSVMNGSFLNFGLGLGVRLGAFGLHVVSDNVVAFFTPQNAHTANARFGIDFVFGCREKRKGFKYSGPGCNWEQQPRKP